MPWPVEIKAPAITNTGLISQQSSILKLDYNKVENIKPITLHFPDGKSTNFMSWAGVMRNVSQWLYNNGHITTAKQSDLLNANVPATAKGEPYNHVKLADNLFINLNYIKSQTIARIQKLLIDVGYMPKNFTLILKDDSTRESEPQPDTPITSQAVVRLLDLDHHAVENIKPITLHFPDGKSTNFMSWAGVMRNVSQWLYNNGHITTAKQSDLLNANVPATAKGEPYNHVKLADNLFINLNYIKSQTIARIQKLLIDVGYKPHSFAIALSDKWTGADERPAEAITNVHNTITDTTSSAIHIQDLDHSKIKHFKPIKLYFPDDTSTGLTGWAAVMREVGKWLYNHGHMVHSEQSSLLDTNVPTTSKGKPYRHHVQLASNLFINLHYDRKHTLQRVQKLLTDIGHKPHGFAIVLQDEETGARKQTNQPKTSVQLNITDVSSPTIPIQNLDYSKIKHGKPITLHFPDATSTKFTGWSPMMRDVAKWLHDNGHLVTSKQSSLLDANVPMMPKGKPYNHMRLASGLFINLQYNGKYTLQRVKKLLLDIGYKPDNFKLAFEDYQT